MSSGLDKKIFRPALCLPVLCVLSCPVGRAVYAPVGLLVDLYGLYNILAMVDHLGGICAGLVAALRP